MIVLTGDRQYKHVPKDLKIDENVFPSVSEIPSFLTSIRHPGRSRSVSIGPQSQADAYETLAYRDKKRRESLSSPNTTSAPKPKDLLGTESRDGQLMFPSSSCEHLRSILRGLH